jgi:hypothetical protein
VRSCTQAGEQRPEDRPASPQPGRRPSGKQALYIVTIVRLRHHQPTRDYVERRTAEGLSKREIIRCLKRYIAREVFAALARPPEPELRAA